jgi:3-hydroxyisobutyrate dehydrogenase
VAGADLDVVNAAGTECSLSQGDALQLTGGQDADATTVNLAVLASKGGKECAKGDTVSVSLQDLQDMQNHMRQTIDTGMKELAELCEERGKRFIDAPVVYGASGAREGTLLSLCGGSEEDIERARPVLMAYSRNVLRVGPVGAGQLAKACNNLLHWVHCVSNYETLLLAKRFGVDAQKMREVLLECPAFNLTLKRWDSTRFTWQEKDMDVTMDLAQQAGLVLPLAGQVDQLVKLFSADDVKALLYGPECTYLGVTVTPMSPDEGGLG